MEENLKWVEIPKPKVKAYQLGEEPEAIYVVRIRDDEFMIIHEDAFGIKTGVVEFLNTKELHDKYGITYETKEDCSVYQFTCHSCKSKQSGQNSEQLHEVCSSCFSNIEVKTKTHIAIEVPRIEAECNDCDWKGIKVDMVEQIDKGKPVLFCPCCNSEDIYYF